MKKMKKDWEIYRDTGVLGDYRPEGAVVSETENGGVVTIFKDTMHWDREEEFVQERLMRIGDMTFHITSVFQNEDKATSTPTDKLLAHIDMQMENEKAS